MYISLEDDLLFKETMAKFENRHILEDFLETILGLEKGSVHNKLKVRYESPIPKMNYTDKAIRGDLLVEYQDMIINVELYKTFDKIAFDKTMIYAMRLASNVKRSKLALKTRPVIQIVLIDNVKIKLNKEILSKYGIINHTNLEDVLLNDKFQIIYARLDKSGEEPYNENRIVQWLRLIKANTREERNEIAKGDEILMEYCEELDCYMMDETTKQIFREWDWEIFEHQAEERGKEIKALETAKNMLENNLDIKTIKKCTGLSLKDIKAITL